MQQIRLKNFLLWPPKSTLWGGLAIIAAVACGCATKQLPLEPFQRQDYLTTTLQDVEKLESAVETQEEHEKVDRILAGVLVARADKGSMGATEKLTADVLLALDESLPEADLVVKPALKLLKEDASGVVRYHALRLLRHYRSEKGVEKALRAARDDEDVLISSEARMILD